MRCKGNQRRCSRERRGGLCSRCGCWRLYLPNSPEGVAWVVPVIRQASGSATEEQSGAPPGSMAHTRRGLPKPSAQPMAVIKGQDVSRTDRPIGCGPNTQRESPPAFTCEIQVFCPLLATAMAFMSCRFVFVQIQVPRSRPLPPAALVFVP
jgi:hypothetical protein